MTLFYILLAGIITLPILMILPALRSRRGYSVANRDFDNVNISKQRMEEIENSLETDDAVKRDAILELQAALLEDLKSTETKTITALSPNWWIVIIILIPLLSLGLYSYLGSPQFVTKSIVEIDSSSSPGINVLLEQLEEKLIQEPDNPLGWELAAKTYMTLGNFGKAEFAYEKLNFLVAGNADFLVGWADATIMEGGNVYTVEVKQRIDDALAMNPNHIDALWIASLGAESLGEHALALNHLNSLYPLVSHDKNTAKQIELMIERNHKFANIDTPGQAEKAVTPVDQSAGETITVELEIAAELNAKVDGNDTVFVFAKAVNGPAVPLAVVKHQAKELPLTITLTEQMAMMAGLTIATFDEITVAARISKTRNPIQQVGDLVSNAVLVTMDTSEHTVMLVIDQVVK